MKRDHFISMHYFIIIFFVLSISSLVTAQQRQSNISRGSSLTPTGTSSWMSSSGLYAFGFYQRDNGYAVGIFLAGIPDKTVVWTANRDDSPVSGNANLLFTAATGKLVLKTAQGEDTNIADVSQTASSASMLDTGNFVLYNSGGKVIWESFSSPTDTLLPTQRLSVGMQLISSVSETNQSTSLYSFGLYMQPDGNLVQYPSDYRTVPAAYYASGTDGMGDKISLNLDIDGNLYLLNATDYKVKNITEEVYATRRTIYLARIDWDGIFRLYSYNLDNNSWSVPWNSTSDRCGPRGLCGINMFCISHDLEPGCSCLPGFAPVIQEKWTPGCERNFTAESCKNKDRKYTIQEEVNTIWEDLPYSVLSQMSKEDCRQACLEDCNCEVALYKDGKCKKQRLPLKYGRRSSQSDVNIALVKVEETSHDRILPTREGKKEISKDTIIIIISCLFSLLVVNVAILGIIHHRYRASSYRRISYNGNINFCGDIAPRSFSYAELERMTDGFKEEIGRGSSGTVYKGTMMNDVDKFVAAKRLQKVLSTSEKEFQTEIKVIGRAHHRNLLRLLGYSIDGPNKVLVYEYMSNGSLADILFTPERQLNWVERMGIARDIARGILYLHDECETQIIHCDIKPQNILMDQNGCAKVSDFGLAKLMKPDETKTFTGIRGTRGYVAPEWHRKLPVTVKVDVYSFGVVLLEIICCRKNLDQSLLDDQIILEEWVYQCFEGGKLDQLVGVEEVEARQLERIIKVALWCILDEPSLRPSMKKVLLMLEGTVDIPTPPNPTSFISTI
ncbi:hypothetical protein JRO89_XS08G0065200 [Xanthoceras sorbifolium]|uniref:Receptor-like serine/threonine-protein kinase n=1 Tax=Xanthoceras sorbifolium TaxID=99658 RepID=A0ABQ8HP36_9ROSI|nr:hypothetical protein JRO89_XS08G0065200 [Xanthoceras sorbifolium]